MRQPTPTSRGRGFSGRGTSGRGFGRCATGREEAIPDVLVGNFPLCLFYHFKVVASEIGSYSHACEGEIICKLTNTKVYMDYFFSSKFELSPAFRYHILTGSYFWRIKVK